jgi:hypothetical protein
MSGDDVRIGDFRLICLHTPGHTDGHMCLYEPQKKFLISGDHILGDITPSIQIRNDTDNPLQVYLDTLPRFGFNGCDLSFAGPSFELHYSEERIETIVAHHKTEKKMFSLQSQRNGKTVYEVATSYYNGTSLILWMAYSSRTSKAFCARLSQAPLKISKKKQVLNT